MSYFEGRSCDYKLSKKLCKGYSSVLGNVRLKGSSDNRIRLYLPNLTGSVSFIEDKKQQSLKT